MENLATLKENCPIRSPCPEATRAAIVFPIVDGYDGGLLVQRRLHFNNHRERDVIKAVGAMESVTVAAASYSTFMDRRRSPREG
jgi:hypothetical protein